MDPRSVTRKSRPSLERLGTPFTAETPRRRSSLDKDSRMVGTKMTNTDDAMFPDRISINPEPRLHARKHPTRNTIAGIRLTPLSEMSSVHEDDESTLADRFRLRTNSMPNIQSSSPLPPLRSPVAHSVSSSSRSSPQHSRQSAPHIIMHDRVLGAPPSLPNDQDLPPPLSPTRKSSSNLLTSSSPLRKSSLSPYKTLPALSVGCSLIGLELFSCC